MVTETGDGPEETLRALDDSFRGKIRRRLSVSRRHSLMYWSRML